MPARLQENGSNGGAVLLQQRQQQAAKEAAGADAEQLHWPWTGGGGGSHIQELIASEVVQKMRSCRAAAVAGVHPTALSSA